MAKKRSTSKSTRTRKPKCKMPNCTRTQVRRGQCDPCYRATRRLVNAGATTWDSLESQGLALPAKKPGRRPTPAFEAITGGVKNTKINKSTKKRPVKK